MECKFNVQDERDLKKIRNSKKFTKYPNMFLSNTCQVKVNPDEYLPNEEFTIHSKYRILPRKIYLYGKKGKSGIDRNSIFLNFWTEVMLNTIEEGYLYKNDFEKSNSKLELCIGLPLVYRSKAYNYRNWTKQNIISFISCLFDTEIVEADYEQQDLLEDLLAA